MKTSILFLILLSLFTGCETGTKYDKNITRKEVVLSDRSGVVDRDIEALIHDGEEIDEGEDPLIVDAVPEKAYVPDENYIEDDGYNDTSEGEELSNQGLEIHNIRVGQHDGYTRLVLDVYKDSKKATSVGAYQAKYYANRNEIIVMLNGYSKFTGSLPSFPSNSVIKQILFSDQNFSIKLRQEAKVRIFDLKNPARLAFDIKPI